MASTRERVIAWRRMSIRNGLGENGFDRNGRAFGWAIQPKMFIEAVPDTKNRYRISIGVRHSFHTVYTLLVNAVVIQRILRVEWGVNRELTVHFMTSIWTKRPSRYPHQWYSESSSTWPMLLYVGLHSMLPSSSSPMPKHSPNHGH